MDAGLNRVLNHKCNYMIANDVYKTYDPISESRRARLDDDCEACTQDELVDKKEGSWCPKCTRKEEGGINVKKGV